MVAVFMPARCSCTKGLPASTASSCFASPTSTTRGRRTSLTMRSRFLAWTVEARDPSSTTSTVFLEHAACISRAPFRVRRPSATPPRFGRGTVAAFRFRCGPPHRASAPPRPTAPAPSTRSRVSQAAPGRGSAWSSCRYRRSPARLPRGPGPREAISPPPSAPRSAGRFSAACPRAAPRIGVLPRLRPSSIRAIVSLSSATARSVVRESPATGTFAACTVPSFTNRPSASTAVTDRHRARLPRQRRRQQVRS